MITRPNLIVDGDGEAEGTNGGGVIGGDCTRYDEFLSDPLHIEPKEAQIQGGVSLISQGVLNLTESNVTYINWGYVFRNVVIYGVTESANIDLSNNNFDSALSETMMTDIANQISQYASVYSLTTLGTLVITGNTMPTAAQPPSPGSFTLQCLSFVALAALGSDPLPGFTLIQAENPVTFTFDTSLTPEQSSGELFGVAGCVTAEDVAQAIIPYLQIVLGEGTSVTTNGSGLITYVYSVDDGGWELMPIDGGVYSPEGAALTVVNIGETYIADFSIQNLRDLGWTVVHDPYPWESSPE